MTAAPPPPPRAARAALLALALLLPFGAAARAHSELRSTEPAAGAELPRPPAEIVLRFNEAVQVTALRLHDAEGRPMPLRREGGSAATPAREARALPERELPPGEFRLEWRAISADGHAIGGTLRSRVQAPSR